MTSKQRTKLFSFVLFLLQIGGQNLLEDSRVTRVLTASSIISHIAVFVLSLVEPFLNEMNPRSLLESYEILGLYFQGIVKIAVHRYYITLIRDMLEDIDENFWPMDRFGPELEAVQREENNCVYKYLRLFFIFASMSVFVIIIRPIFSDTLVTPFKCYEVYDYNDHVFYYCLIYGLQVVNLYFGPILVIAYDSLFIEFISQILCQMMMLNRGIETLELDKISDSIDEEKCFGKIKMYVDHHCRVLRILEDVKKVYSSIFLCEFLATTVSLCISIYMVLSERQNILLLCRAFCLLSCLLLQLGLYCLSGSKMESEYLKLVNTVFYSGWEGKCGKRIRQAVSLMLLRAQKPPILSAEGMLTANLEGFGNVIQFSISIYTLMSSMMGEN